MEYVIKELKDNVTDNYLKDIITIKGISIDKKLEMIKTYMNDVITSKLEFERILCTTKSVKIAVDSFNQEFALFTDNDSIVVNSFEDFGALIKKLNKKADYKEIIQYLIHLSYNSYNEFDIKLVKCLNSNTSSDKLKKATDIWLKFVENDCPRIYRLGDNIVIMGHYTDEQLAKAMNDTFMNTNDFKLKLLVGKWINEKVFGDKEVNYGRL